jgi:prevent-host-death family protein
MKSMGLFEVKNRFSEVCGRVARGLEPVIVTRRGRPLVRIVPIEGGPESTASVWDTVEEGRARYGPLGDEFELPSRDFARNRPDPLS